MKIFSRQQKHKMQTSTAMVTRPMHLDTPIDYAERSGAAFLPTLESHVFVPLLEAIVSGLFAGLSVGAIICVIAIYGKAGWLDALFYGFIVGLIAMFFWSWWCWAGHLGDYKSLLMYTEFAEGPEQVQENKQVHEARVKVNNNWIHADLPFDRDNPQALVDFASAVAAGIAPFSERGAGRYGYSVVRFNELRDSFIRSKLAYWKDNRNKRLGVGLSRSGLALLKNVANTPPPPNYEPPDDWGMSPEIVQK